MGDSLMENVRFMEKEETKMIDLHIHILPELDDGAESLEEAVEMAEIAVDGGIDTIAATSHGDFSLYNPEEYLEVYRKKLTAFRKQLIKRNIPLKVCSGMELMVNESLLQWARKGALSGINGGKYLLVEFLFDISLSQGERMLEELLNMGYKLILAHPERYDFVKRCPEALYRLYDKGIILQVNKGSILGYFGRRAFYGADWMLSQGMAGVVASDAHDPVLRTPGFEETARILDLYYGKDAAKVLLERNPSKILK